MLWQTLSVEQAEQTRYPTQYFNHTTSHHQDWGEVTDISSFYGRSQELATLEQWIVEERCHLVAIVGTGGIGKTTLSVRCAKQIQDEFECIIWRSLHHAPPLLEMLTDLLQSLSNQQTIYFPTTLDEQVSRLIEYLHKHRCLLILDSVEAILRQGELAGYYCQEHENYRELLRRIIETPHQSCLLLTGLELPKEIAAFSGNIIPVRCLRLTGLQTEGGGIFKEKVLSELEKCRDLIQLYRGNPLALKIVATTIQDLFGGNISEFFKHNTIFFGDIRDVLDEQFESLSALEIEILYWLALEYQPISLLRLQDNILPVVSSAELIEALPSLERRYLIINSKKSFFTIQKSVVVDYVIEQFINRLSEELIRLFQTKKLDDIKLLKTHCIFNQQEKIKIRRSQIILTSIKDKLYENFRDEIIIEEQLTKILSILQSKSPLVVRYAQENVQNLLLKLKTDLKKKAEFFV